MVPIQDKLQRFADTFEVFLKTVPEDQPIWLRQLRKEAMAKLDVLGFPTLQQEEWRQTHIAPVIERDYALDLPVHPVNKQDFSEYSFAGKDMIELVFVNGRFVPELSHLCELPEDVRIKNLTSALGENPEYIEPYLARLGSMDKNAFTALNTAFMQDGAYIHIPANRILERPIHCLFLAVAGNQAMAAYPRNVFVIGNHAQVSIIESYAGLSDDPYLTNAVTEFAVGENATVDHYRIQRESLSSFHISNTQVHQDRHANFKTHNIVLGGLLTRNDIDTVLDAEGITCTLNGLYVIDGNQHVDNHTLIVHEKPHCESHELYKGILSGASHGVFRGKIFVQKDAQKTDAKQDSKTLLLSNDAEVNAMPQLEIYADDVKCTHGATTGHLDDEAIFYLQSRGVKKEKAEALLTYAFASDLLQRMELQPVRERLDTILLERLSMND